MANDKDELRTPMSLKPPTKNYAVRTALAQSPMDLKTISNIAPLSAGEGRIVGTKTHRGMRRMRARETFLDPKN